MHRSVKNISWWHMKMGLCPLNLLQIPVIWACFSAEQEKRHFLFVFMFNRAPVPDIIFTLASPVKSLFSFPSLVFAWTWWTLITCGSVYICTGCSACLCLCCHHIYMAWQQPQGCVSAAYKSASLHPPVFPSVCLPWLLWNVTGHGG